MGISLSGGPWQYNRFRSIEEAAKPDYLDFDKDGNKKEPMKKALKEKGKKPVSEEKKEMPDFIKKKMEEKKGKKEGKKDDCGCDEKPCKCDDKEKKEEFNAIVKEVLDEGHDLSEYSWDELYGLYEAMMDGPRKDAMKKKGYMANSSRDRANAFNIGTRGDKSPSDPTIKSRGGRADKRSGEGDRGMGNAAKRRMRKEEVESYLVNEGFANNSVSAEVMYNHMSEEWLAAIEESLG